MSVFIKDGGVWKESGAGGLSIKDSNTWKTVDTGLVKDGGVWKEFYKNVSYWFYILGNPSDANFSTDCRGVYPDSSGNIYAIFWHASTSNFLVKLILVKLDPAGAVLWQRGIDLNSSAQALIGNISADSSGNVYFSFYQNGTYLYKYNSSGTLQWGKRYSLGGFVPFNATNSSGDTYLLALQDGVEVAKINSSGNIVWQNKYGGTDFRFATGIALDNSENPVIVGYYRPGSIDNAFTLKINSSGVVQWCVRYSPTGNEDPTGVGCDGSGNIYVKGDGRVGSTQAIYVVKQNSSGAIQWYSAITPGRGFQFKIRNATDASGSVYLLSTPAFGSDFPCGVNKLDTSGNVSFGRTIGSSGNSSDIPWDVQTNQTDSYFVAARFRTSSNNVNFGLVSRLPLDGSLTGTYSSTVEYSNYSISRTSSSVQAFTISASPSSLSGTLTNASFSAFTPSVPSTLITI